jgi:uncharacterized membrane protein
MSNIIVFVYDDPFKAHEARAAILRLAGEGHLQLDETAVAIKPVEGKVKVFQDVDVTAQRQNQGHWVGIAAALLTGVQPLILVGTAAGAVVGRLTDKGITKGFIKQVQESLTPGTSALFIQGQRVSEPETMQPLVRERLRPFGGKVLSSTLPPELEQTLKDVVEPAD